jgi:hypothetical protein
MPWNAHPVQKVGAVSFQENDVPLPPWDENAWRHFDSRRFGYRLYLFRHLGRRFRSTAPRTIRGASDHDE